jgi:TolB-like protein
MRNDLRVYEFSGFQLDAATKVLQRGDERVRLAPRVFDTLLYFVEHPKQLLDKRELMAAIWPDSIVEENNLNQQVANLRRILGDDSSIVTVPGRGYRFAADVTSRANHLGPLGQPGATIAVLPFANMTGDTGNEYFCEGVAEELLTAFAKVPALRVAARTSAFSFRGKDADIAEIGRALSVGTVLEGSVRRSNERWRITAQLIDVSTGYHLWSERYDVAMADVFVAQDKIALAVVDALHLTMRSTERAAMLRRYTHNTDAYNLYLKGRYFWFKTSPDEFRRSREFFEKALAVDPAYALGHVGLAYFYGFGSSWGLIDPAIGWPKMEASISSAAELDDSLAEVHNGLAALKWVYYRDWAAARHELERAIELNPNFAEAHNVYSIYLAAQGKLDDAIRECRIAVDLDPLSVRSNRFMGLWLYYSHQYEAAAHQYRQTLEIEPGNAILLEGLADACERTGAFDEAAGAWRALFQIGYPEALAELDKASTSGSIEQVNRVVASVQLRGLNERVERGEYVPAAHFLRCSTRLGDVDAALRALDVAVAERNSYAFLIGGDPFYDRPRSDPRFGALVGTVINGDDLPARAP